MQRERADETRCKGSRGPAEDNLLQLLHGDSSKSVDKRSDDNNQEAVSDDNAVMELVDLTRSRHTAVSDHFLFF